MGPARLTSHFKLSRIERTWKHLLHDLLTPCLVCIPSASPLTHTTDQPPLSLLSEEKLQHLILVPSFSFNKHQGRFIKAGTLAGGGSARFGLPLSISPPALGKEQPGWRSCYTLVQEMPSAKCPLLSGVLASGLKRTSCTWQLKSITAVTGTYAHSLGWRWILALEGGWASGQ